MSDEEKRIEELEQQLKIEKLEKELAEAKNSHNSEENKTEVKNTETSMWSEWFEHPWIASIGIVLLIGYLANSMFDIDTIKQRKDGNYCVNLKPTSADRRMFCAKNEADIEQFKKCVKSPQLRIMYTMDKNTFGQYSQASDDSFYNACKMSTVWEKEDKSKSTSTGKNLQEANDENQYYIDDYNDYDPDPYEGVEIKTYNYKGIDIEYNAKNSNISEITPVAKQCYDEGNTDSESLNQCVGIKLRWF